MSGPEHSPQSPERSSEQFRDFERAPEILDSKAEKSKESREEIDKNIEKAREEVNREVLSGREVSAGEKKTKPTESVEPKYRSRHESYTHTMKEVRSELSTPERAFSRVIHNPFVEKTSEVVGSTIARPDAILSGSVFACLLVLTVYLLGKYYGFALQGSETIATFVIGWAIGLLYDLIRGVFRRRKQ